MNELSWLPSISNTHEPTQIEYEVQSLSSVLLVTPWAAFVMAYRWAAMCLLLTSAAVFLELVQTASSKCSAF